MGTSQGTLPVQQSQSCNGTQSPGDPLSVCTEGKPTGAEEGAKRFKRVSNSEGNRGAFVWSSLPLKVEKWNHISPLTAAAALTPWVELLMMLCSVEVDRRGVPEACCFLSEIRLNRAALVHTHAWEKPGLPVTDHNLWALLCITASRFISHCRIKYMLFSERLNLPWGRFYAVEYLLTVAHCRLVLFWPLGMETKLHCACMLLSFLLFYGDSPLDQIP